MRKVYYIESQSYDVKRRHASTVEAAIAAGNNIGNACDYEYGRSNTPEYDLEFESDEKAIAYFHEHYGIEINSTCTGYEVTDYKLWFYFVDEDGEVVENGDCIATAELPTRTVVAKEIVDDEEDYTEFVSTAEWYYTYTNPDTFEEIPGDKLKGLPAATGVWFVNGYFA